ETWHVRTEGTTSLLGFFKIPLEQVTRYEFDEGVRALVLQSPATSENTDWVSGQGYVHNKEEDVWLVERSQLVFDDAGIVLGGNKIEVERWKEVPCLGSV
ncbi:hypothetical protein MPER_06305, partial [Moniliophthora perniciosa FA553]